MGPAYRTLVHRHVTHEKSITFRDRDYALPLIESDIMNRIPANGIDNHIEENDEQRDADQAQDVTDDALDRTTDLYEDDSEDGSPSNPGAVIPDDVPDLIDTMNQMLTSGRIDNGAYAGEPMDDDEEDILGETDNDDDDD
jgi:hypothetical protein